MTRSGRPRTAVVCLAALTALVALAGCAAAAQRATSTSPAPVVAGVPAAPCLQFRCAPGPALALPDGYQARLWSSPPPAAGDRSVPVVELLHADSHVAWWTGRLGTGYSAQLTCLGSTCLVVSTLGAHGGAVETLLFGHGAFATPATASVEFDSGTPVVRDLDGDGVPDVIGVENDYTPNFAQGHNYWATYRLVGPRLVRTGCERTQTHPATPTTLLTGSCPVIPNS